jgi:hypothetical protein
MNFPLIADIITLVVGGTVLLFNVKFVFEQVADWFEDRRRPDRAMRWSHLHRDWR